jgi:short-subunit dehydrogenase
MKLSEKTAIVTGAGGAIGSNLVKKLEENGVTVVTVDWEMEYGCDFTDSTAVAALVEAIKSKYHQIDMLFNVAGVGIYKKISNLKFKEWLDTYAINVHAPFLFSKILLGNLKSSGDGLILNVGSGMGVIGAAERTSYCSSKFALRGLSLSLSKELQSEKVDVVLLTLGSVMTPFGTGGIDKRKELERSGKKYLSVDEVTDKIIEIVKSEKRDNEYTLYPEGYL